MAIEQVDHPGQAKDLAFIESQLVAWLKTKLPADQLELSNLRSPSSNGYSSGTLLFDVDWTDDGGARHQRFVARMAPTEFSVFPTYDLGLQSWVMRTLAATDVPVPHVCWTEDSASWLGAPFYVMHYIEGRVPDDVPPMHVAGWITELLPEQREAMWWSGLEAMTRVHRVDWQALGLARLANPARGATPLAQQLHYYDEFFSWGLERARFPLIESALSYLKRNQPANQPVALCWGDARLGNQIFLGQKCVAVLDWEMVNLGNPVADLAWWMALDRCFSEGVSAPRLAGFPDRNATIRRWEELSGRSAEHFDYYQIFALFRFNIVLARVLQNMKRIGTLEPDDPYEWDNLGSQVLARALAEARV